MCAIFSFTRYSVLMNHNVNWTSVTAEQHHTDTKTLSKGNKYSSSDCRDTNCPTVAAHRALTTSAVGTYIPARVYTELWSVSVPWAPTSSHTIQLWANHCVTKMTHIWLDLLHSTTLLCGREVTKSAWHLNNDLNSQLCSKVYSTFSFAQPILKMTDRNSHILWRTKRHSNSV